MGCRISKGRALYRGGCKPNASGASRGQSGAGRWCSICFRLFRLSDEAASFECSTPADGLGCSTLAVAVLRRRSIFHWQNREEHLHLSGAADGEGICENEATEGRGLLSSGNAPISSCVAKPNRRLSARIDEGCSMSGCGFRKLTHIPRPLPYNL